MLLQLPTDSGELLQVQSYFPLKGTEAVLRPVGCSCRRAKRPRRGWGQQPGRTGGFPLWKRGRGHVHPLQALPELSPLHPRAEKSSSGARVSADPGEREPPLLPASPSVPTADPHRVFSFSLDGDV